MPGVMYSLESDEVTAKNQKDTESCLIFSQTLIAHLEVEFA